MRRRGAARLGIDFGTTHTVVSVVDRGNYPAVSFEGGEFVPSLVAVDPATGEVRYGTAAAAASADGGWDVLRSFKRHLREAGPQTSVAVGGRKYLLFDLLAGYFANLKNEIYLHSNAGLRRSDRLQVGVSVPANSLGAQRFLTLDAYRRAGFEVFTVLNEPSAAGFEYAHRHRRTLTAKRELVLVYDLGGGTFDASLIHMAGLRNEVVTSAGISALGGDDFDEAILRLVTGELGFSVPDRLRPALLDECRRAKEQTGPSSRRFVVDLGSLDLPPLVLPVERVFEACAPLVEETLTVTAQMMSGTGTEELAGVYAVGGASRFPLVYRRLRDLFGQHRVHRSPYPFASTAIGLAVFLDEGRGHELAERLTRSFGVWRESEEGRGVWFDVIFPRGAPLPSRRGASLAAERRYRAAHNVGHFRFIECSRVEDGRPAGDLLPWAHILFPLDPSLRGEADLPAVRVTRLQGQGPEVLEEYRCGSDGTVTVTITILADGYSRSFTIAPPPGGAPRRIRGPGR